MNFDISTNEGMQNSIAWQRRLLDMIVEGGVWCVPRSCAIYTVSHANKTLTRTGLKSDSSINKVATAMGWTVIEKELA